MPSEAGVTRKQLNAAIALLNEEFGDAAVDLIRRLKAAWDPLNILNPGKVVTMT